jgi:hypothetical protein
MRDSGFVTTDAVVGLILGALITLVGALLRDSIVSGAREERLRAALHIEIASNIAATAEGPHENLDPFVPIDRTAWEAARLLGFDEDVADDVVTAYRLGARYNALVARTEANIGDRPGGLVRARLDALTLMPKVNAAFTAAARALRRRAA